MSTIDQAKASFIVMNLLAIGLLAALLVNLLTIQPIYPDQNLKTTDRRPVFAWSGMQGDFVLFVDDNPGFASPATADVSGNSYAFDQGFDFGTYYWKVESGPFLSGTGRFAVLSSVAVSRNESGLKNEGNTEILLSGPSITGAFVLGVNESVEIGEDANVEAEQA